MPVQRTCHTCGAAFFTPPSDVVKFCSRACRSNRPLRPLAERFWEKVRKEDGCWLWTGGKTLPGYGLIALSRTQRGYAHRVSFELNRGPIGDGLLVCHTCDNPACVRPDHLFVGTDADNARDKVMKGRSQRGILHPHHRHPERVARGERSAVHKLTTEQVLTIRARYAAGGISQAQLGADFGVSATAITAIVNRRNWKHVT